MPKKKKVTVTNYSNSISVHGL